MSLKIAIVSTKGGTGKTTLTVNLGAYLAQALGQRVLIVDADPQSTASSYFPLLERAPEGLLHLVTRGKADVPLVVSRTTVPRLDVVISDDPQDELYSWILNCADGRVRLKYALQDLDAQSATYPYDFIIIDSQGAKGPLQEIAVLAADLLLSPIPPEILSAREFSRGTVDMLTHLVPMVRMGAPVGPLRGIIYKQNRTADARQIAQELRAVTSAQGGTIPLLISIMETVIPAATAYTRAATQRQPVHIWDPRRRDPASATPCGAETMRALVAELFPHLIALLPEQPKILPFILIQGGVS